MLSCYANAAYAPLTSRRSDDPPFVTGGVKPTGFAYGSAAPASPSCPVANVGVTNFVGATPRLWYGFGDRGAMACLFSGGRKEDEVGVG